MRDDVTIGASDRPGRRRARRDVYGPGYFGAFVLDPDGHNVEAVDHGR